MHQYESAGEKPRRLVSAFKAATLTVLLAAAVPAVGYAQAANTQTRSGQAIFFLTNPASAGTGIIGRGTLSFQGKDYPFKVTGLRLARTAANTPKSLSADVYSLNSPADIEGDYTTVGTPSFQSYVVQNAKGVRVELTPILGRSNRLPVHDSAHPLTITLLPPQ